MAKVRIDEEWTGDKEREKFDCKGVSWFCPGCGYNHFVYIEMPNPWGWSWKFNGDLERPTLTPSVDGDRNDPAKRCHCVITDGNIQFLPDCGHALAGQTVPMVDIAPKRGQQSDG